MWYQGQNSKRHLKKVAKKNFQYSSHNLIQYDKLLVKLHETELLIFTMLQH